MIGNDNATVLTNKLQKLIKMHEKIIETFQQNIKVKLELGLIRYVNPEKYDKPTLQESDIQEQASRQKQKSEPKCLNQEFINQHQQKNRKQVYLIHNIGRQSKKNIKHEICSDQAGKIILNNYQDFQNSHPKIDESNNSEDYKNTKHQEIQKQIQEDEQTPKKIIYNRAQNQQSQKELCNICNRVFNNIKKLNWHQETAHKITFIQQEPPLLKKYVKE